MSNRTPMSFSGNGMKLLKQYESWRPVAYQDSKGVWTIGYGHTGNVKPGMQITSEAGEKLFRNDLKQFEDRVNRYVKVPLNQNQYDALVMFDYNTHGLGRSSVLKSINNGDYEKAFTVDLPEWNKITNPKTKKKEVSSGLVNRRGFESKLGLTPVDEPTELGQSSPLNPTQQAMQPVQSPQLNQPYPPSPQLSGQFPMQKSLQQLLQQRNPLQISDEEDSQ